MTNIIIRQVIGRTLVDANREGYAFELNRVEGHWQLRIQGMIREQADMIRAFIEDSNIFYTEEEPGQPVRKWWLYDKLFESRIGYRLSINLVTLTPYTLKFKGIVHDK
jgi:hypothetical protein